MPKNLVLLIASATILLTAYFTLVTNAGFEKSLSKTEIETAVNQAKHIYRQEKIEGRDFSNGPCLSDALQPGWVVDIAHDPRIPLDDFPQNQCPGYLEGKAKHFVELDTEGNLIRTK